MTYHERALVLLVHVHISPSFLQTGLYRCCCWTSTSLRAILCLTDIVPKWITPFPHVLEQRERPIMLPTSIFHNVDDAQPEANDRCGSRMQVAETIKILLASIIAVAAHRRHRRQKNQL